LADALGNTLYHLAHTRNQAAVPVLVAALAATRPEIRRGAIHGLVVRREPSGHAQILARLAEFSESETVQLTQSLLRSPHRMQSALRESLLTENERLCDSACRVILMGRVYQLIPTLVEVAENLPHRHSAQAAASLLQLSSLLQQETLAHHQDKTCEPALVRRQVLPALEKSLSRYGEHLRLEIIDAFLLLTPSSNDNFRKIIQDPTHPCHRPVVESLATSAVVPTLELLTQLLHDTNIPRPALEIIAHRSDRKFLDHLLHGIGSPVSLRVLENLRKLQAIDWLSPSRDVLLELDGQAQITAIEIAKAHCADQTKLLSLLRFLLEKGQPEARRATCDALVAFSDPFVDKLVVKSLADPDPRVQAAAVRQLRQRSIHDAMERLVALLDDPAPEVRAAARSSLAEFSFSRYRESFDMMDDSTRQKIGRLVLKIDPTSLDQLMRMLGSPSHSVKLQALQLADALDAADMVVEQLAHLLEDPDVAVRTDAAAVLGSCHRPEALQLLCQAAEGDPNLSVREAAGESIHDIHEHVSGDANCN